MKPSVRKVRFGQKAAHVRFDGGDWDGAYHVITSGRTEIDIAADINALQLHHEKKSARLSGFANSIVGTSVVVRGQSFTITDCTLRERGTDVELYVSAINEAGARLQSMPIRRVYGSVDEVPTNPAILAMITNSISGEMVTKADESSKIGRLKQQFGDDTP